MKISSGFVAGVLLLAGCRKATPPDAYGNVEATEVVVGAQANGQLESFTPAEGNTIASGETVAVVDTSGLVLQLDQLEAQRGVSGSRVNEVRKQIGVLETQQAVAQRTYDRTKRLFDQQAATAQQLDAADRDLRTLNAQIEQAKAQRQTATVDVSSSDARVAQIRDQIRKSKVANPVSGTVLTTFVKAGEFVQTGQPLYKIANLDTLELRAYISEPQLAGVKVGQQVQISIDTGTKARRTLSGTVSWISSQAEFTPTPIETRDERTNLVYAIKVRVPNTNRVLKIGMPADVQLTTVTASR